MRNKAGAATLTLAAHVFLVALLLLEKRFGARELPPAQHVVGQWITLSYIPLPPEPEDVTETPVSPRLTVPLPRTSRPDRPSSAITLVSPPAAPEEPAPQAPPAGVDWRAQAAELAARYAEEVENPATFSPPPVVMREPCKPRQSSFWPKKKEQEDGPPAWTEVPGATTMVGGIPIGVTGGALGGGAVGGMGIAIPLGKPEPNKHLFDDMKQGKTPVSSVPHHERCD